MCGIAGYIDFERSHGDQAMREIAGRQGETLRHRGPDSGDVFVDHEAGIALAHRRLAVIDLSPAGSQPMISSCGRMVIVYNGEIYNADELREELRARGRRFTGRSDTEVLLEGCAEWGTEGAVNRVIGMFAFAVWDRESRTLSIVRDRLGIKPLYYYRSARFFILGSELKALRAHPDFVPAVNPDAVASYLRYQYVPSPHAIFRDTHKLQPGTVLRIGRHGRDADSPRQYWSFRDVARGGIDGPEQGPDTEVVERLDTLLADAVRRRMIADVPLGVFLSGGIDSSTVAALMQESSSAPVRTFSIGFEEAAYDEARHAAEVADHLGTDHTELTVTSGEARDVIPLLGDMFDEPFGDSSQIPTYLVSAMTRKYVTVALSGDGGDELFAGYNRYQQAGRIACGLRLLPLPARRAMSGALLNVPVGAWDRVFALVPSARRPRYAGDKVHKFASAMLHDENGFYRRLVSQWDTPEALSVGGRELPAALRDSDVSADFPNYLDRMQYWDTVSYLPDDILTKVDRASMAVSLEVRVPLLDHRVVEYAWRLPHRFRIRDGASKWVLRQILYRRVPRALLERPKMGFALPLDAWLRGPLREWAGDLLSPAAMNRFALVRPEPVTRIWQDHLAGRRNWSAPLWNVLMFQSWCVKNL